MFGISWSEMAVISVLALIIIGPKDLPKILRTIGQWTSKAQRLAAEFRRGIDQMAKEAGVDDVKRQVQGVASLHPANQVKKAVLGTGTATSTAAPPKTDAAPATARSNGAAEPSEAPKPAEPEGPARATGT